MNPAIEENKQIIAATDNVIPFPDAESYKEARAEREAKKKESVERANALLPIFRLWIKRTLGRDALMAYRDGGKWTFEVTVDWLRTNILENATTLAVFQKAALEATPPTQLPEVPKNLTSWEIMKAMMIAVRRYNFGMRKGATGYMINCGSDHEVVQALNTGEFIYKEPDKLTFELWRVKNNDYDDPFKIVWAPHPDDPNKRIQIKQFVREQSVLKPWESNKQEPELDQEDARNQKLAQLKEGEWFEVKFSAEHESEAEQQLQDFLGLVDRVSGANNTRFHITQIDPYTITVHHGGMLYRAKNPNRLG